MHDRNELCSELGLNIMDYILDSRSDGVLGDKCRVYDDTKAFNLEVGLV